MANIYSTVEEKDDTWHITMSQSDWGWVEETKKLKLDLK